MATKKFSDLMSALQAGKSLKPKAVPIPNEYEYCESTPLPIEEDQKIPSLTLVQVHVRKETSASQKLFNPPWAQRTFYSEETFMVELKEPAYAMGEKPRERASITEVLKLGTGQWPDWVFGYTYYCPERKKNVRVDFKYPFCKS